MGNRGLSAIVGAKFIIEFVLKLCGRERWLTFGDFGSAFLARRMEN
jgi:hypothetical protein